MRSTQDEAFLESNRAEGVHGNLQMVMVPEKRDAGNMYTSLFEHRG